MKLYEIDQRIAALVDEDTGEIANFEEFESLQIERETKLENMALWYKDLRAEAEAIKKEAAILDERQRTSKAKADKLKSYLEYLLNGDTFKTPKVSISYKPSVAVEVEEGFESTDIAAEYLTPQPPKLDKRSLGDALKAGVVIPGASLRQNKNIQIK